MTTFQTHQPPFVFVQGTRPLLVSMPHVGTYIPPDLAARLTPEGQQVPDTDWHLPRLYDFVRQMGCSLLIATHSRYVIDLNRPPDGASLYPGQSVTGLCPVDLFNDQALYQDPQDHPSATELAARREAIWQPYHHQLQAELDRLKAQHGRVALWDAHSIRSVVPRFFEGVLPDLNLGTADGHSCDPVLAAQLLAIAQGEKPGFSAVLNGRFKGGYITRQYGQPAAQQHAVQLEMTQHTYMQEQWPFAYDSAKAVRVQPVLRQMLEAVLAFVEAG